MKKYKKFIPFFVFSILAIFLFLTVEAKAGNIQIKGRAGVIYIIEAKDNLVQKKGPNGTTLIYDPMAEELYTGMAVIVEGNWVDHSNPEGFNQYIKYTEDEQNVVRLDYGYSSRTKLNPHIWLRLTYKDGVRHGDSVAYNDNGNLKLKGVYKDGEQDGIWEYYYDTGELYWKTPYKDGGYHGTWLSYHRDGTLQGEERYKNRVLHGKFVKYYSNGQVREKGKWVDGHIQHRTRYNKDGTLYDKVERRGILHIMLEDHLFIVACIILGGVACFITWRRKLR